MLILILPRFVLGTRLPKQKGVMKFLLYFLCLGAGYILIQVALIQKFVLLLGRPTYALTVIVFSMLVASGLGSYFSRGDRGRRPATDAGAAGGCGVGGCARIRRGAAGGMAATWPLAQRCSSPRSPSLRRRS